jgi:NAD(P)-dependent dehydrogenase (short-subunit alcohol dehydrogenase family)
VAEFSGKVAIVAGGTLGIGRATAQKLAAEDASVVICSDREDQVKKAACTSPAMSPSQVLRVAPDGTVVCPIRDEEAHLFCHPTNLAFRGNILFTTNLGRWHIAAVDVVAEGPPLYGGYGSER